MESPAQKMATLVASPEYAAAVKSYSNGYINGAALQKPGSVGFKLWLLYSNHLRANGAPPSTRIAEELARDHGLNTTSATNALGKWSAYYGLRPPRSGAYAASSANRIVNANTSERLFVARSAMDDHGSSISARGTMPLLTEVKPVPRSDKPPILIRIPIEGEITANAPQPAAIDAKSVVKGKKHNERCSDCKNTIIDMFRCLYGQVKVDHKIDVPIQADNFLGKPVYKHLKRLLEALEANRGHKGFIKLKNLHRCDLFVPAINTVVEFDESQHFTNARKISLSHYPEDLKLGFDPELWKALCDKICAKDNDPEYRDEQRAWYDAMRDFLPIVSGLNPTIRIHMGAHDWCSLDVKNPQDVNFFRSKIAGLPSVKGENFNSDKAVIATVNIESHGDYNNASRCELLKSVLERLDGTIDAVVLPAGFFKVIENASSVMRTHAEAVTNMLNELQRHTLVCFGIDGRGTRDQIAVAVNRAGILGVGRKFHPTDGEKGLTELAPTYTEGDSGFPRIINIKGKNVFLAVCYDGFGIRQKALLNPGVQVVFDIVHGFRPQGEGSSGEVYFAKHAFAGSAKQWDCPVFGSAVFFNREIPSKWPTGVVWDQEKKSTKEWRYSDNPLLPEKEFRLEGTEMAENSVIQIFTI